jgi:hypothetical protein
MKLLLQRWDDVGRILLGHPSAVHPGLDWLRARGRDYPLHRAGPMCSRDRLAAVTAAHAFRPEHLVGGSITQFLGYSPPTVDMYPSRIPASRVHIGKWHCAKWTDYHHPMRAGFDHSAGAPGNLTDYYSWLLVRDGVPSTTDQYATRWIAEEAIRAIEVGYEFIQVDHHAVHRPFHVPPLELCPRTYAAFGAPPYSDFGARGARGIDLARYGPAAGAAGDAWSC